MNTSARSTGIDSIQRGGGRDMQVTCLMQETIDHQVSPSQEINLEKHGGR